MSSTLVGDVRLLLTGLDIVYTVQRKLLEKHGTQYIWGIQVYKLFSVNGILLKGCVITFIYYVIRGDLNE